MLHIEALVFYSNSSGQRGKRSCKTRHPAAPARLHVFKLRWSKWEVHDRNVQLDKFSQLLQGKNTDSSRLLISLTHRERKEREDSRAGWSLREVSNSAKHTAYLSHSSTQWLEANLMSIKWDVAALDCEIRQKVKMEAGFLCEPIQTERQLSSRKWQKLFLKRHMTVGHVQKVDETIHSSKLLLP